MASPDRIRKDSLKDVLRSLRAMEEGPSGKVLRSGTFRSLLSARDRARQLIPVGKPPYESWSGKDPYPLRSYKGLLRTPGFAQRSIVRKSKVSKDGKYARTMLGVKPEAFYAVNFIEFGTSKITKQPWLEPALRQSIPDIDRSMTRFLKIAIDRAIKKKK